MALFDIKILDEEPPPIRSFIAAEKVVDEQLIVCKQGKKPEELFVNLQPGVVYHYLSFGDWSMYNLIDQLLNLTGPAHFYFSTWGLSEMSARKLVEWLDEGRITGITALVDVRAQHRHPAAYHLCKNKFAQIKSCDCHAKVAVLIPQAPSNPNISVLGSANFTENPRIECGIVSTNAVTANLHANWIKTEAAILKDFIE